MANNASISCSQFDENIPSCSSQHVQYQERKKSKSDIFEIHYTKMYDKDGNVEKAKCNYCQQPKYFIYRAGGGFGTLTKHLNKKHPSEAGISTSQTQLTGFTSSSPNLFKFSDEKNKKLMTKFISMEHLPFSFGEKLGFIDYCQNALNPQAKRMPRSTIRRELKKIYKEGKNNLIEYFSNLNNSVSICSDIWSDKWEMASFMGITCHWIDNDWFLQKRIIAYRIFPDRHTANNISRLIKVILDEYGLCKKIFSIGFDNASANTKSIQELKSLCEPTVGGKFFHIRCACHILNLAVQDGLKTLKVSLSPIREAINYLWSHPNIMKEWQKYCINHGGRPKRFTRDVPNRWNSTYDLLLSTNKYSNLLCSFFMTHHPEIELHPNHWIICQQILRLLQSFKNGTCILSGVYYPTAHLFIQVACNIVGVLFDHKDDPILEVPIKDMLNKWLVYYKRIPLIFLVASVFDPRVKFDILDNYLTAYYDCINGFFENDSNYEKINVYDVMSEVKATTNQIYCEFQSIYGSQVCQDPISTGGSSTNSTSQSRQISTTSSTYTFRGDNILKVNKKQRMTGTNAELELYLKTSFEFPDGSETTSFPILEWWKHKEKEFPVIAIIAKHILAVPASTVAVEQAFSEGGIILDDRRTRLSVESIEALAVVADWTKAARRDQEMRKDDDFDLDYDTGTESDMSTAGSSSEQVELDQEIIEDDED